MRSLRRKNDPRRAVYLALTHSVETQLREAYAELYDKGILNQKKLADKLGVSRAVISRRLSGHQNMTLETLADLVWALDHDIKVSIFGQNETSSNSYTNICSPTVYTSASSEPLISDVVKNSYQVETKVLQD